MTSQSFDLAAAYVTALTGSIESVLDFRALHDIDKSLPGQNRRGTLQQWWQWLCGMNDNGYGIFVNVNAMAEVQPGEKRDLNHVQHIRAHVVDHDGPDAQQQHERAALAHPAPGFVVYTSPGKYHTYWPCAPYLDNERYKTVQRKLRTVFNGDRAVVDATRVLRVPGTLNRKYADPWLVSCAALSGYGQPTTVEALEQALQHVQVLDAGDGERKPLGEGDQAPSLDWLRYALTLVDPADLDRAGWLEITTAFKQAGWTLADENTLRQIWDEWCARYPTNNIGENNKMWADIKATQLGWNSLTKRVPSLKAAVSFGVAQQQVQPVAQSATQTSAAEAIAAAVAPPPLDCSGEYLTHLECQEWFKGCVFVTKLGQILTPSGRFMNSTAFNGAYGGKQFIITGVDSKKTDEPWKAALRSTLWTIPKVDHTRFLPHLPHGEIVHDDLGRVGVNTYKPAVVRRVQGDVTPFLNHLALLLPDPNDQRILIEWMAHNVKYPGYKIPWAPVIQSTEGAGKGVFKRIMTHALGKIYVHFPNAKELTNSGSQFNGWLRGKLFILADEIKVDDRRDLIEVLKPLISEEYIEIQSKGVDQELEDNFANWMFFTNYKDAIPINKNGRRYAIFYSALQNKAMKPSQAYYDALYQWLRADGDAMVTDWLMNYPIERGAIPMDAPPTSSYEEALAIGRSGIERVIVEAVEDGVPGFRNGWISTIAAANRCKAMGAVRGGIAPSTLAAIIEGIGYVEIGRADRPWLVEDRDMRTTLYGRVPGMDVSRYGADQGWE